MQTDLAVLIHNAESRRRTVCRSLTVYIRALMALRVRSVMNDELMNAGATDEHNLLTGPANLPSHPSEHQDMIEQNSSLGRGRQ